MSKVAQKCSSRQRRVVGEEMEAAMAPENMHESILEFLKATQSLKKRIVCPCGTVMEHEVTKFFYNGESWEVLLPICRKCYPANLIITHDA
jgi:hypothetical protein